ncbi:hypothetical protein ALC56_00817 [Trachymyrmex septentrionalis]|uniref:Uncharacterized protein n=1 Tax=Trachymyrmex septentrionalis TaxID=34720 RepID=A0A195FWX7_9HYME|nr:hypothetical protein ALC56_00817 [Trachymyrmex septentrionalis]
MGQHFPRLRSICTSSIFHSKRTIVPDSILREKVARLKDYYNQDAHSRLNKVEQSVGIVNNEARGIGPVEFVINPTFSVRVCAS